MSASSVLRPYVAALHAYDQDLGAPGVHRGLPGTTLTLVVAVDDPLDVGWADGSGRTVAWASLAGLHDVPAAIRHDGHQRGVMLELTVPGARALLGVPAGELAGRLLRLEEVAPRLAGLAERLAETRQQQRAEVLREVLAGELGRRPVTGVRPEVAQALTMLGRGDAVATVADEVGYSRRRLTDLVVAECGVTPSAVRRLARFERARRLVGWRPLAEVAARAGYADQAHLSREWRELAGCTPSTWLREEFPFVQDAGRGTERE